MAIVYQNGIAGKICANPECGWKPLSEFHPQRLLGKPVGDGYKYRCRECANAQSRAEYAANIDKYRNTSESMLRLTKIITANSSALTKKKILKSTMRRSESIVKLTEKKSMPKPENVVRKNWSTIEKQVESLVKNMPKNEMLISGSTARLIEIN